MDDKLYDILDEIVDSFSNLDVVKEYKNLNKIVEEKYALDILYFQSAKEKLEENKKYSSSLSKYEKSLSLAKEKLYSYPEVKRLKECENIIQKELDKLSNDISKKLSNKFRQKRVIEWSKEIKL